MDGSYILVVFKRRMRNSNKYGIMHVYLVIAILVFLGIFLVRIGLIILMIIKIAWLQSFTGILFTDHLYVF